MSFTKCPKCGQLLSISAEQTSVDINKVPEFTRFGFCDYCKVTYCLDTPPERRELPQKKKESVLGILGLIFAVTIPIVGLVLSLIDVIGSDKNKAHACGWTGLGLSIAFNLISILF